MKTISLFLLTLISIALVASMLGVRIVEAGEVGVVVRFGEVTGRTLEPGAHIITPFAEGVKTYNTKKVTYETSTEEKQQGSKADYKDYPVDTNTADGQPVDIAYTVRFSVDPTQATTIANTIGSQNDLVEKIVKTESRIWARNIPRRFEAEVLYTGIGSETMQNEIFDALKPIFLDNGLILDTVGIREIYFDDAYVNAIKAKQIEAVAVETAKNTAEKAKFEKEARITKAEGESQEQELQKLTLSNEVLRKFELDNQKSLIDRWNGVYPSTLFMGASDSQFILPITGK